MGMICGIQRLITFLVVLAMLSVSLSSEARPGRNRDRRLPSASNSPTKNEPAKVKSRAGCFARVIVAGSIIGLVGFAYFAGRYEGNEQGQQQGFQRGRLISAQQHFQQAWEEARQTGAKVELLSQVGNQHGAQLVRAETVQRQLQAAMQLVQVTGEGAPTAATRTASDWIDGLPLPLPVKEVWKEKGIYDGVDYWKIELLRIEGTLQIHLRNPAEAEKEINDQQREAGVILVMN